MGLNWIQQLVQPPPHLFEVDEGGLEVLSLDGLLAGGAADARALRLLVCWLGKKEEEREREVDQLFDRW